MANRSVTVNLIANVTGYVAGIKTAAGATKDLGKELKQAAEKDKLDTLTHNASMLGAGLLAVAGTAVYFAARFDKAMSGVAAATNASAAEMEKLRQAALQAGADTAYSATEAAQAITELAKAGVATEDILGGGLKGALDLAAAGQMEVADAAEIAATAMVQFGLSGQDIPHVADLLAAGAGKAQGEVADMGMALKQAGLVASQFGISVEETAGTLAAFASAGLLGSDAGTSLKTMLLRLAAPAGNAADLMTELGINAYDAQGRFVGLEALAGQLQTALGGMTQQQRDAALATIFGADAIRAANVLYREGATGIDEWVSKVNDQGFAADTAAKKTDNLAGDIERLTGSLETLFIQAGSQGSGPLRVLVQMLDELVSRFAEMPPVVSGTILIVTGLAGAALLAGAGFLKAKSIATQLTAELVAMGPAGTKAAGALSRIGTAGAVVAGKAARLVGILATLQIASAALGDSSGRSSARIALLAKDLEKYGTSGQVAGEATDVLGSKMQNFADDILIAGDDFWSKFGTGLAETIEGLTGLGDVMDDSAKHARQNVGEIDAALAQLVQGGNVAGAEAAFERLRKVAGEQGISLRELKKAFPEYFAALRESESASEDAASGAELLAGGMDEASLAGRSLIDVFNELNGAAITYARAQIDAERTMDALTASLRENGNVLTGNSEKALNNREALLNVADAAIRAADAKYQETGSLQAAKDEYDRYIDALRQTLRNANLTEEQIDNLIETYFAMPDEVETHIKSNAGSERGKVKGLKNDLEDLDGTTIQVYIEEFITKNPGGSGGGGTKGGKKGGLPELLDPNRWGSIHHARNGLITSPRQAGIYSDGPIVMFAEPETGGEAFIPRLGDRVRSKAIVEQAAQWYGGRVDWTGRMTPRPVPVPVQAPTGSGINVEHLEVRAYSDRFSIRQVQDDLAMHGVV